MIKKIDKFVCRDPSNYSNSNGNGSSSTKRAKFISFSVNNRSSYFEQFTTTLKMIYVNFNNVKEEIDKSIGQDPNNHSKNNAKSSTRRPKFISFFVNNRSSYSEQLKTTLEMM